MKRIALILGMALTMSGVCWAGYRTVPESEAKRIAVPTQDVQGPEKWSGTVRRADGQVVTLQNLGDRFASVPLSRGEQVEICLDIPGLESGENIRIASTHGGKIEGKHRTARSANKNNEICFPYTMGTMGPHPVIVTLRGRSITLLFQTEEEITPKESREQKAEEEAVQ